MTDQHSLAGNLRQMLAVLETERQALAAMDVDALVLSAQGKHGLCGEILGGEILGGELAGGDNAAIDAECRSLLEAARHQNEVNRKIRNLLAANVAARLDALTRNPGLYTAPQARRA